MTYPEREMEQREAATELIERPDPINRRALKQWLDRYVDRPFAGYEDRRHRDGTPFSDEELLKLSKKQLRGIVREGFQIGRTTEQIAETLMFAVESLREQGRQPVMKPNFPLTHK